MCCALYIFGQIQNKLGVVQDGKLMTFFLGNTGHMNSKHHHINTQVYISTFHLLPQSLTLWVFFLQDSPPFRDNHMFGVTRATFSPEPAGRSPGAFFFSFYYILGNFWCAISLTATWGRQIAAHCGFEVFVRRPVALLFFRERTSPFEPLTSLL